MVIQERTQPRDAFTPVRGACAKQGERVQPGIPAALSHLPPCTRNNRLSFARWLVDPAHPLTARVTINRYWPLFFGTGLVRTAED